VPLTADPMSHEEEREEGLYDECEGRDPPVKSNLNRFARQIKKLPSTEDDYALSPSESDDAAPDDEEDLFADHEECGDHDDESAEDCDHVDRRHRHEIPIETTKDEHEPCVGPEVSRSKSKTVAHVKGASFSSTDSLDRGQIGQLERLIRTHAVWLLGSSGRSVVTRLLIGKPIGSFIVRASSKAHTMALSVRLPVGRGPHVEHYLIEELAERKLHLEGSTHYFSVLPQLICHYCQCSDELPVQLQLPTPLQTNKRAELARQARLGEKFWDTLPCEPDEVNVIEPVDRSDSGQPSSLSPGVQPQPPPPPPPHHPNRAYLNERALLITKDSPPPVPPKSDALCKRSISLDESADDGEEEEDDQEQEEEELISITALCPPRPPRGIPVTKSTSDPPPVPSRHTKPAAKPIADFNSNDEPNELSCNKRLSVSNDRSAGPDEQWSFGGFEILAEEEALIKRLQEENDAIDLELLTASTQRWFNQTVDLDLIGDRPESSASADRREFANHQSKMEAQDEHSSGLSSAHSPTHSNCASGPTSGVSSCLTSGFASGFTSGFGQPDSVESTSQPLVSAQFAHQKISFAEVNGQHTTSIAVNQSNVTSITIGDHRVESSEAAAKQPIGRTAMTRSMSESPHLTTEPTVVDKRASTLAYGSQPEEREVGNYEDIWTNRVHGDRTSLALTNEPEADLIGSDEDKEIQQVCSSFVRQSSRSDLKPPTKSVQEPGQRDQCSPFYCDPIDAIRSPDPVVPATVAPPIRPRTRFGSDPNLTLSNAINRGESNSLESLLINFRNCIYESWPNRSSGANHVVKPKEAEATGHTLRIKLNQLRQLHARSGSAQSGLYGCKPISLGTGPPSGQPDMCWQVDSSWRWQNSDEESSDDDDELVDVQSNHVEPVAGQSNGKSTKPNEGAPKLRSKRLDSIDRKMRSDQLQPYRRYSYRYVMESGVESETEYESSAQVRSQVQALSTGSERTAAVTVHDLQPTVGLDLNGASNDLEDWTDLLRMPDQMAPESATAIDEPLSTEATVDNVAVASITSHTILGACNESLPNALTVIEDDDDDDDDEDEIMFEEIGLEDDLETNDELDEIYEERRAARATESSRTQRFLVEDPYMARNQLLLRSDGGRQLADYISSLVEQSDNTFAMSIERFVRCTLESGQLSGRVVMRNVRQFMSGLKNYLGKHGEKEFGRLAAAERSRLSPGEFLNMDAIIEGSLHSLVLRPLRDHIYSLLQQELTANGSVQQLRFAINRLVNQTPIDFVVSCSSDRESSSTDCVCRDPLPSDRYLAKVKQCLAKLSRSFSPLKKLEHLLGAVSVLQASLALQSNESAATDSSRSRTIVADGKPKPIGADKLMRPLAYALVHAQFFDAELECEYMWNLLQPTLLGAEGGYYLSTLSACVHALKQFGGQRSDPSATDPIRSIVQQDRRSCSNSSLGSCGSTSNALLSVGCVRVLLPDELSGQLRRHTLPLRMSSSCREAVRLLAHRFQVHASDDYALMRLQADGSELCLQDTDCPLQVQSKVTADHPDQAVLFVFKRRDAQFIWPHLNQL
jgi:hypothetical protein